LDAATHPRGLVNHAQEFTVRFHPQDDSGRRSRIESGEEDYGGGLRGVDKFTKFRHSGPAKREPEPTPRTDFFVARMEIGREDNRRQFWWCSVRGIDPGSACSRPG
jgi:hypothetical protein